MIEAKLITRFVDEPQSFAKYRPALRAELFLRQRQAWDYLCSTYDDLNALPTREDVEEDLPDFEFVANEHAFEWMIDELTQQFLALRVAEVNQLSTDVINPRETLNDIQTKIRDLAGFMRTGTAGRDLLTLYRSRYDALKPREQVRGLLGITTGFDLLDEISHGTLPGDIEFYFARPGMGKTLVLLYGAFQAIVQQKKRISFLSPEMSEIEIGFRLDTLMFNYSNMRLMGAMLKQDELDDLLSAYEDNQHRGFLFHGDQGRFSTSDIARIIANEEPDLMCIDGLLMLEPAHQRENDTTRQRIVTVCEELKAIAKSSNCPIRIAHQANREIERQRKGKTALDFLPELHHLAEAGATEQYATRVVALRHDDERMWFAVRKNRNGPGNLVFHVRWNIDLGEVTDEERYNPEQSVDENVPENRDRRMDDLTG